MASAVQFWNSAMWCSLGTSTPPVRVHLGVGDRLAQLTGLEVLPVDQIEQLDRLLQVGTGGDDLRQVQPVALDDGVVGREREHPVEDDVVGHQVHEHVGPDRHRVVAAVLVVGDAGDLLQTLRAVDGEALDVVAEDRAVTDEVLRGEAVGELRAAPRSARGGWSRSGSTP